MEIIITKEQLTEALLESGKFPNEEEDYEVIDEVWNYLVAS